MSCNLKVRKEDLLCKRDPMLFEVLSEYEEPQPAASPEACDGVEPCTVLATHTHKCPITVLVGQGE